MVGAVKRRSFLAWGLFFLFLFFCFLALNKAVASSKAAGVFVKPDRVVMGTVTEIQKDDAVTLPSSSDKATVTYNVDGVSYKLSCTPSEADESVLHVGDEIAVYYAADYPEQASCDMSMFEAVAEAHRDVMGFIWVLAAGVWVMCGVLFFRR